MWASWYIWLRDYNNQSLNLRGWKRSRETIREEEGSGKGYKDEASKSFKDD